MDKTGSLELVCIDEDDVVSITDFLIQFQDCNYR